ncbi:MAG: hypothetical protein ACXWZY_08205 [Gaiellaceae bacterium]
MTRWAPATIVSVDEATAMTSLDLDQLLTLPGAQLLDRTFADGARDQAIRLPAELVSAHPVPAPAANKVTAR